MLRNRVLTAVLVAQLFLTFFFPPIAWGERSIFAADVWLFAWVSLFWVDLVRTSDLRERKSVLVWTLGVGLLFAVVYLHGSGRPNLASPLSQYIAVPPDGDFNAAREAVVGARFFVGCVAAMIVSRYRPDRTLLLRMLAALSVLAALSMVAAWAVPGAKDSLGAFYGYDPYAAPWPERIYGVFRSPIEACVTLCLAVLLLSSHPWARTSVRISVLILIGLGIFLSKTVTAAIALGIVVLYAATTFLPPRRSLVLITTFAVSGIVTLLAFWNSPFFSLKRENFLFRFKPWSVYWESALSRPDRLLLGNGFHPYFSDAIYVFLFSRGGLLLLGTALVALFVWWRQNGAHLNVLQKAIILFFLLSGITVDNLILRPVAYVFICVGVLVLKMPPPRESPK